MGNSMKKLEFSKKSKKVGNFIKNTWQIQIVCPFPKRNFGPICGKPTTCVLNSGRLTYIGSVENS